MIWDELHYIILLSIALDCNERWDLNTRFYHVLLRPRRSIIHGMILCYGAHPCIRQATPAGNAVSHRSIHYSAGDFCNNISGSRRDRKQVQRYRRRKTTYTCTVFGHQAYQTVRGRLCTIHLQTTGCGTMPARFMHSHSGDRMHRQQVLQTSTSEIFYLGSYSPTGRIFFLHVWTRRARLARYYL